ncbi:MAG TPA: helix-turn-helix transcriptional regulator [Kofleriaceae bacterium]|jgi:transcriptional regulator with XRE-family HTH domain
MVGTQALIVKVGLRIRALREQAGLTREALAAKAGVSTHYMGAIERGARAATLETLAALGEALDVSLSELLAGVDRALPRDTKRVEQALAGRSPDEQRAILEVLTAALKLGAR